MKLTDQTPELPTTEHVRFIYSLDGADYVEPDYREYKAQEFDRWLATVEAAAEQRGAEQGWDEAITAQIQRLVSGDPDVGRFHMPANPYRTDRLEGESGDV